MSSPSENAQVRGLYRANSAIYIPDSAQLCLGYQSSEGECTIRIGSFMVPGSEGPVPNGIWIKSEGSGASPHDAELKFRNLVDDVAALAAFLTNASTEEPTLEILYDVSAHRDRHEALFSSNTARYSAPPIRVRECPSFIDAGMKALSSHEHSERLWRGVSSYVTALRSWRKGHEPVALAFLYMATEALTYVARDSLFSQFGDADGLAAEWNIEKKVVDSEIRKRILFAGDDKLYKAAKDAEIRCSMVTEQWTASSR